MLHQLLAHQATNRATQKRNNRPQARKGLTNILENENDWTVEVLAPGYQKSDFTMKIENNTLHISTVIKKEERKFFRREFRKNNQIDRSFELPKNIDSENITANLEAGILSIVIPKNELAKPQTIKIK